MELDVEGLRRRYDEKSSERATAGNGYRERSWTPARAASS